MGRWSPDGQVMALAGWDYQDKKDGKPIIMLWGLAAERPLYRLDQGADYLSFSPDGRTLLGVGRDGLARARDRATARAARRSASARRAISRSATSPSPPIAGTSPRRGQRHGADLPARARAGSGRAPRASAAGDRGQARAPTDLWKQLIGRPAPEFRGIKAWAGGAPVRLADLRGKFVLLHFWNLQSEAQMVQLMAMHEKFADQGLVVIVVQRDWGVASVEDWQARALRGEEWGNRPLPFRLALDGGGPTPIEGTDAKGPGATYAAFGVQESRQGWRLQAVNLLVGPDGKVVLGVDSPWTLGASWRRGWASRRRSPRGGSVRSEVRPGGRPGPQTHRTAVSSRASRLLALHLARLAARRPAERGLPLGRATRHWGSTGSNRLRDVLDSSSSSGPGSSTGPPSCWTRPYRATGSSARGPRESDLLKALEPILADERKRPIHFTRREVEREVIVAGGRYQFHPLGDRPDERAVHLGTESLPSEDGGGGGSGSLREMLDWLGDRAGRLVIDETESSNVAVQWRDHLAVECPHSAKS